MKESLVLLVSAVALCCCTPKNAYQISGTVPEGYESGQIYLVSSDMEVLDSAAIVDGHFSLKGEAGEEVREAYLMDNTDVGKVVYYGGFFIEPGKMTVSAAEGRQLLEITGTKCNDAKSAFSKKVYALADDDEQGYAAAIKESAETNTDNIFGLKQLYQGVLYGYFSGEEALGLLGKFPEEFQTSKTGNGMKTAAEGAIRTAIGKPYIDFSMESIKGGETISLKSVIENPKNKYVLLDFWASWCSPCMGEVPSLLKAYADYKSKGFEIFGCSLDSDGDSWKKAVSTNKMDWVHVSDLKYWKNAGAEEYGVRSIPANFLIDCSNGTIVASNLRGSALEEQLAKLLD